MAACPIHQLMKIICAVTKAKKRRTPMTAIDPGVRNLSSEFAPRELMRLEFEGRIVFADTFSGLILGGINLIINCYFFLLLFTTKHFAKKEPTFSLYSE
jgi:hypothetical protein|tara:strand:- start:187 stop:483 length:297 start_codon:yes stop_codon:yes gene_type:complete